MRSSLAEGVDGLIASQAASWPLLARGLAGLRESRTRAVRAGTSEVLLRHVPHRMKSTTAAVDPESVARRPCFLCRENLPPEEQGLDAGDGFTAYCNPFPVLEKHLTIVHAEHRPQAIAGRLAALAALAEALPGFFVLYNGPECGASAPDHLHFQACAVDVFPIGGETRACAGPAVALGGRRLFLLRDADANRLAARLERLIQLLAELTGKRDEPLVNLCVLREKGGFRAFCFPRAKHRPRAYETGELTVSPAAIDLSGVLVVPLERDFARIGGDEVAAVFDEVSLAPDLFAAAAARLHG
jgi:hypothetical protein